MTEDKIIGQLKMKRFVKVNRQIRHTRIRGRVKETSNTKSKNLLNN